MGILSAKFTHLLHVLQKYAIFQHLENMIISYLALRRFISLLSSYIGDGGTFDPSDHTYHHVHGSLGLHRAEAGDSADPLVEVLGILLYIVQCFLKEVLWGAR